MFNENKPQIYIAALYRNNRHAPTDAKFHGFVLVRPKKYVRWEPMSIYKPMECSFIDVTDAIVQHEDGTFDANVEGKWRFRARHEVDVLMEGRLVGAVMVGKIPRGKDVRDLKRVLGRVDVPVRGRLPRENCWSWVVDGMKRLQREGWIGGGDVEGWVERVKMLGERTIQEGRPKDEMEMFADGRGK